MHPLGSWLIRRAIPLAVTCGAAACSLTTSLTGLSGADDPDAGQSAGDAGDAGTEADASRDASASDAPLGGGYYAWKPPIGTFFVTATPYSGSDRTGTAGAPLQVRFTVQP